VAHTRIPDRSSELLGNCLIRAEYRNGKNPSISVTFEQSDYYDRALAGDNCPCVPNQPEMPHARLLSALTMTRRPMAVAKLLSIPSSAGPLPGVRSMPNPKWREVRRKNTRPHSLWPHSQLQRQSVCRLYQKRRRSGEESSLGRRAVVPFEVTTEEHQRAAAALPEGAIIAQRRFSLSPASSEIIGKAPPEGSRRALDGEVH
jgi:hypothetical protein